jgi:hypothetical protein
MNTTWEELTRKGYVLMQEAEREQMEHHERILNRVRESLASALTERVWNALGLDPRRISLEGRPGAAVATHGDFWVSCWIDGTGAFVGIGYKDGWSESVKLVMNNEAQKYPNECKVCMLLAQAAEVAKGQ